MDSKSFSNGNGPGHGNSHANGPVEVRHGWFCSCIYCLIGLAR